LIHEPDNGDSSNDRPSFRADQADGEAPHPFRRLGQVAMAVAGDVAHRFSGLAPEAGDQPKVPVMEPTNDG
jgi:hypothetical protein